MSGTTTINLNVHAAPSAATEPAPGPEDGRAIAERLGRPVSALAADTRKHGVRAEIPSVGGDASTAVIRLYDVIDDWGGYWGVSANEFAAVLDELPDTVTTIDLRVNSPGGMVYEGLAIMNMLRNHPARVTVCVEGIAASAASFIACGQDELVMCANSELMIHNPRGGVYGDAAAFRKFADRLDAISANIASVYQAKAGGDLADWLAAMDAETWYSAQEAVAAGLADTTRADTVSTDDATNRFDLSTFNFAGRQAAPGPTIPDGQPAGGSTQPPAEGGSAVAFSDEQLTDLRQKLGVADDADEANILAAVDDLLEQATAPSDPQSTPDPTASLPEGIVAIEEATLAELKADAADGRAARAEQLKTQRESLVAAAITDGRIAPARRDHWLNQLEADPGAEQVLANLEKGLIPVDGPVGSNGAGDLDTDDALFAQLFPDTKETAQ